VHVELRRLSSSGRRRQDSTQDDTAGPTQLTMPFFTRRAARELRIRPLNSVSVVSGTSVRIPFAPPASHVMALRGNTGFPSGRAPPGGAGDVGRQHRGNAGARQAEKTYLGRPRVIERTTLLSLGGRKVIVVLTNPAPIDGIAPDGGRIEIL
jgi:hypothetical protein